MSEDLTKQQPQSDSEKLSLVLSTVQAMAVRVDSFEQTVKAKLYDARPILQRVIADIAQLQEGQEALRSELRAFRLSVDHRFMILSGNVLARCINIEQRVTILELNTNPPNSQT